MRNPLFLKLCRFLTASLLISALPGLCTGCYKGDGTELPPTNQGVQDLVPDPHAAEKEALFTNISEDPNAKKEYPFSFDAAAVAEPQHDILLVMIYENYENGRSQTVNFFDKNGYAYRYRQPLDLSQDNWISVLQAYHATGNPVNQMSAEEQKTLWYFSEKAEAIAELPLHSEEVNSNPVGIRSLYLMTAGNEPVLLARYHDTASCRDSAEVSAFANWFRYYFHGTYEFPPLSN